MYRLKRMIPILIFFNVHLLLAGNPHLRSQSAVQRLYFRSQSIEKAPNFTTDSENATLLGRWTKGPSLAVTAMENGHVYFGDGAELVSAVINASGSIAEQGRVTLPGAPKDIAISSSGTYAYVAMGYQGVAVVDIQSANTPELLQVLTRPDDSFEARAIAQSGQNLYIAAGHQGLLQARIIDADSLELGAVYKYEDCETRDVAARNDTLFLANYNNGLEMLRYADEQFHVLNHLYYNKYLQNNPNQCYFTCALFWQHDSLFIADGWTGLFYFTVQDTALHFSGVGPGPCTNVTVKGSYVYSTDYYNLNVFEVTDGVPVLRDSKSVSTSKQLAVAQNYVIVASKRHGIYTYDISDPATLGSGDFFATSSVTNNFFQQGTYLYRITPINTLDIISVFNPTEPHTVGHLDLGGENREAVIVYVQGDTAIVCAHDNTNGENIFYVIDVSDPSEPNLLASWTHPTTGFYTEDIVLKDKLLIVAGQQDISVIDFSDLNSIHEVGSVTIGGWISRLAVKGNYVFIANYVQGMNVIDISDPTNPSLKTTFRESDDDSYYAILIRDSHAFIGDEGFGLKIIDISNPLSPVVVGSYTEADGDFYAEDLAVSGNYAYIMRNEGEVIFLNISDFGNIQLKGVYNNIDLGGFLANSRMLYVSSPYTGIFLISNDNPDALLPCHVAGDVSGEWTCGTIYVEGDITIPAGDTLRISDSVEKVSFLGPYQIKVQGVLLALGPENEGTDLNGNRILFTGSGWHGILFNNLNDSEQGTSIIENCRFDYADKTDMSDQGGGAISIYNSDQVIVRHSVFYRNTARLGGAVYIEDSAPQIEDCYFEDNGRGGVNLSEMKSEGGGAMFITHSSPYLHRLRFTKNGSQSGGAMVIDGCSPVLSNMLFEQNRSSGLAGAVVVSSDGTHPAEPRFVNVTVADNEAPNGGGAFQLMGPVTHPQIINSILYDNAKPEIYIDNGTPTVTYSIVDSAAAESWFGAGCLTDDPLFDESGAVDYHLKSASCGNGANSPAIDAGHPDSVDTYLNCSAGLGTTRADMGYYGGRYADLSTAIEAYGQPRVAEKFLLSQNYPNPFNPSTLITYELPIANDVKLVVYNTLGQKVRTLVNQRQQAGRYSVTFDATGLASGVYWYRLSTGDGHVQIKKMILIR